LFAGWKRGGTAFVPSARMPESEQIKGRWHVQHRPKRDKSLTTFITILSILQKSFAFSPRYAQD
jgi:hypothetical protein